MHIAPHTLVSEIAAKCPETIPALERLGIDYCCGGSVPLAAACERRSIDTRAVLAELESISAREQTQVGDSWMSKPLPSLIDHLVSDYHEPLRSSLVLLERLLQKVIDRHGHAHPELLPALDATFALLRDELLAHTRDEEAVCFPYIRRLSQGVRSPTLDGRLILAQLTREHQEAGALLQTIRSLTMDYTPPPEACITFRALYAGLEQFERELHRHVHLENNVLFPRAADLEAELARVATRN